MSEDKLHRELDNTRAGARANDTAKVAWAQDASSDWINAATGCIDDADVADRIVLVCVIEQVEEVHSELKARRFAH